VTGELLSVDAKQVLLRTAWRERLAIPRNAGTGILHSPGFVTVVDDDFENGLKAWKLIGAPQLSDRQQSSGKQSLSLDTPGQSAEYRLPARLHAGKVGINFHDPEATAGARWLVEAEFEEKEKNSVVRVALAGGKDYTLELPGAGRGARVPRSRGWHRLEIEFGSRPLVVGIDNQLLWPPSIAKDGADKPTSRSAGLRAVRLVCSAVAGE